MGGGQGSEYCGGGGGKGRPNFLLAVNCSEPLPPISAK